MNKTIFLFFIVLSILITSVNANLTTSLVQYYKFDESSGTLLTDSLKVYNGTNFNALVNQSGKINKSYLFDGSTAYISYSSTASITSNYTMNVWIKPTGSTAFKIITAGTGSSGASRYGGYIQINGGKVGCIGNSADSGVIMTGTLTNNTWHFISCIFNHKTSKIYVDGLLNASETSANVKGFATSRYFGKRNDGLYFKGYLDEMSIYNKILNSTEISQLYNSGNGFTYPFINTNYTITAKSAYNLSSINSFTVRLQNGVITNNYYTNTGTVSKILNTDKNKYNITFYNNSLHFNKTYLNYNFSASGNLIASLNRSYLYLSLKNKINNNTINYFNVTIGTTNYVNAQYNTKLFCPNNLCNITVSVINYYTSTILNRNTSSNISKFLLPNYFNVFLKDSSDKGINVTPINILAGSTQYNNITNTTKIRCTSNATNCNIIINSAYYLSYSELNHNNSLDLHANLTGNYIIKNYTALTISKNYTWAVPKNIHYLSYLIIAGGKNGFSSTATVGGNGGNAGEIKYLSNYTNITYHKLINILVGTNNSDSYFDSIYSIKGNGATGGIGGNSGNGANGNNGLNISFIFGIKKGISGYFGGGGGGGSGVGYAGGLGGKGGGGNGGVGVGFNSTQNTGSGGGGGGAGTFNGGLGARGIIFIKYLKTISFYAKSSINGTYISSYSVRIYNSTYSSSVLSYHNLSEIYLPSYIVKYNITFYNATWYNNKTYYNINLSSFVSTNYTGTMDDKQVLELKTYYTNGTYFNNKAVTLHLINSTNSVLYTFNGTKYIYNLPAGQYQIYITQFGTTNFTQLYIINISSGSTTNLINLYFPPSTSTYDLKIFNIKTNLNSAISNALVSAELQVGANKIIVGQGVTDSSGTTSMFLENYKIYDILITATGYPTKTVQISTLPNSFGLYTYTIIINSNNTFNFNTYLDYYSYSYSPNATHLNVTSQKFNLTVHSPLGLISNISVYYNSTNYATITGSPTGGSAVLTLNLIPFAQNQVIPIIYSINAIDSNRSLIWTEYYIKDLNTTVTHQTNLGDVLIYYGNNNPYSVSTKIMISCFFIALFVLFMSAFFPSDSFDGSKNGNNLIVIAGLSIATYINFIPLALSLSFGLLFVLEMMLGGRT